MASIGNSVCIGEYSDLEIRAGFPSKKFILGEKSEFKFILGGGKLGRLRGIFKLVLQQSWGRKPFPPPPSHPVDRTLSSNGSFLSLLGTSEGAILVLNVSGDGKYIEISRQLHGHSAAITDLTTNAKGKLASADEQGMIVLWDNPLVSIESSLTFSDSRYYIHIASPYWAAFLNEQSLGISNIFFKFPVEYLALVLHFGMTM